MNPAYVLELRQRFTPLQNRYDVVGVDAAGAETQLAYAEQKRLALKEKVTFWAGADRSQVVFTLGARNVLAIHFVRKHGSSVHGTLDSYRDPDCQCVVTTTFDGSFQGGSVIEGTYSTVPSIAGGTVSGGTWRVTRVRRL